MPWKERSIVEERMRFVLRLKDGESMAWLCREFGISRVTIRSMNATTSALLQRTGGESLGFYSSFSRTGVQDLSGLKRSIFMNSLSVSDPKSFS
jgi:hypothetical protein